MSERRKILKAAWIVGVLTLLSRFTGLIRDAVLAAQLGSTRLSDIFWVAFQLPNLVRRVLGEGALSSFIVPLFSERRQEAGPDAGWRFLNNASNLLMLVALVITLVGGFFAREVFIVFGGQGLIDREHDPKCPRQVAAPLVDVIDLVDPSGLVQRLAHPADPVSEYFAAQAGPELRARIEAEAKGAAADKKHKVAPAVLAGVAALFNRELVKPTLYTPERFAGVQMDGDVAGLAARAAALAPRELVETNRRLLNEAYEKELAWTLEQYLAIGERMTRIMFPYVIMLTVASLMMGALHALRSFTTPSLGSVMLNVAMIAAGALALACKAPISRSVVWLSWAVLAGAFLRIVIMIPSLRAHGWGWQATMSPRDPQLRKLLRMLGVGMASLFLVQINIAVVGYFSMRLDDGLRSCLSYADRLIQFPLALTATAMATAMLPQLTAYMLEGRMEELGDVMAFSKRLEIIVMTPAAVGLMIFGLPIVALLLERGIFGPRASYGTYQAIFFYAPVLLPMSWAQLSSRLFYARQDLVSPLKCSAISMIVNVLGCWFFTSCTGMNQGGLALAFTLGGFALHFSLDHYMRKTMGPAVLGLRPRIGETIWKCLLAALVTNGAGWAIYFLLVRQFGAPAGTIHRAVYLLPVIAAVAAGYFALVHALGVPDSEAAVNLVLKKLRRKTA
ncbi:MAG: murein biosynthesis integral membrane protein MurJ [Candidatus Sumerlaeia bacterium]